jgi:F-type H+-transporting ATPase subunit b
MRTHFRIPYAALLVVLIFTFRLSTQPLFAQEAPKPETHSAQAPPAKEGHAVAEVKDKEEKSGEADWVRQSPSVKWFANKTGLSLNQAYWVALGLNFAVIFLFLASILRKTLPGFFRSRTSSIQKGIEEARKMSQEARRRLNDVEGRLSRLDADIAAMRSEAQENAGAEERRILAASEEERKRIVSLAEQEISMAANAARRELKSYAAELAVDLAEKKIRVSKDADQALVHEFTARLGKDGN